MKVRLTQAGFENYNGQMGVIFFENGISIDDVSRMDAVRLAACMSAEWEDGSNLSPTQSLLDNKNNAVPMLQSFAEENKEVMGAETEVVADPESTEVEAKPTEPVDASVRYTQAQLEEIADAQGIAGLRAICDPLGIKGRAISELIQELIGAGYADATVSR